MYENFAITPRNQKADIEFLPEQQNGIVKQNFVFQQSNQFEFHPTDSDQASDIRSYDSLHIPENLKANKENAIVI